MQQDAFRVRLGGRLASDVGRFALGGVKYFLFTQRCRLTCAPFPMATLKNDLILRVLFHPNNPKT